MVPGNLLDVPKGEKVFVDSNILTYHLLKEKTYGQTCRNFIAEVESGKYLGFINAIVASETLFNFIKAKVVKDYSIKPKDVTHMIKMHPEIVGEISIDAAQELIDIFRFLSIGKLEVYESYKIIKSNSLLTNDALNVASMKTNEISSIATNDSDLLRVEWVKPWMPRL